MVASQEAATYVADTVLGELGYQVRPIDSISRLICRGDRCICQRPLDCPGGGCLTFEENLEVFRGALDDRGERTVICERAETGTCGPFLYFLFNGDIHRRELRFFDGATARLVAMRNHTDYDEYCDGRAMHQWQGSIPACTRMTPHERICGDDDAAPLAPPEDDLRRL